MNDLIARQAEYNREKLGYDRVRSLWTPPGSEAGTSLRNFVPQAVPAPTPAPAGAFKFTPPDRAHAEGRDFAAAVRVQLNTDRAAQRLVENHERCRSGGVREVR